MTRTKENFYMQFCSATALSKEVVFKTLIHNHSVTTYWCWFKRVPFIWEVLFDPISLENIKVNASSLAPHCMDRRKPLLKAFPAFAKMFCKS